MWAEPESVITSASVTQLGPKLCGAQGILNPQEDLASSEVDGNCTFCVFSSILD